MRLRRELQCLGQLCRRFKIPSKTGTSANAVIAGRPLRQVKSGTFSQLPEIPFMALERTFSIIKPDGVARNLIGEIYRRFEQAGLKIVAARMTHLSRAEAEGFYAVHKERPFFNDLVTYMTSGPVVLQVLEGENAVAKNREIMGATDPKKAEKGTIRADLAESIEANTVHGSDSLENAKIEIAYFFRETEIYSR
jgi:nucleoside-diphosphate kinase